METEALRSVIHTGSLFERIVGASRLTGSFVQTHFQAWEFRQQGKTFKEIGEIMGFSQSWAGTLVNFVNFKIKFQKQRRINNQLKELVKKYSKNKII